MDLNDNHTPQKFIEEQILSLNESIAYHEECIGQLKEERNKLEPVSRLPPEILGIVFAFVLDGCTQTLATFPFPAYYFTHVSRSWRSVALHTPCLWRFIMPIRSQWTAVALERSRATGLILLSRFSNHRSLDSPARVRLLKQVLTEHAKRVREIEIDLTQFTRPTLVALFEVLQSSSLRLHALELDSKSSWVSDPTFPTGVVETDSLRRLEIRRCNGPWYTMSFPALTTLRLRQIKNRPSLNNFLDLLRGLTTLRVLDMEDSLPFVRADHDSGPVDPIHLPSLQYLCLSSTKKQKQVWNILSRITVPPTAILRFAVILGRQVPNIASSSLSAFVSHMDQSLSYSTVHILSVARSACPPSSQPVCMTFRDLSAICGHIHLRAWVDDDSSVTPNLEVVLALEERLIPIVPQRVVRKIFPSLPLLNITTLTLEITPIGALLQHTIGNLPCLQRVTVVGTCTAKFIKELTWKCQNYDDRRLSDYYSVSFPALEFLWIRKGNFSRRGSGLIKGLQECLMERYERKAELLKLKLTDCRGLRCSYVEKLREIVVDVEWDDN